MFCRRLVVASLKSVKSKKNKIANTVSLSRAV